MKYKGFGATNAVKSMIIEHDMSHVVSTVSF